jgi:hypothetical protein
MSRSERDILRELGRVTSALLHEKGYIAPVDVFLRLGSLTQADDERWRRGQIPVLERVIQINLTRITFIMQALRRHSLQGHLRPSLTVYTSWESRARRRLRFSVSGQAQIEAAYATHYLRPPVSAAPDEGTVP